MNNFVKSLIISIVFTGFMLVDNGWAQQNPAKREQNKKESTVKTSKRSDRPAPNILGRAPDFELQDIHQDIVTLNSYKNKQPLVLFFWTTWCPFCQNELKVLNDRYAGLSEDGLEVLAINVGETPDKVQNFIQGYNLAYRVPLDKDSSVARSYAVSGVPTYVLVDLEGFIVFQDNYFPQGQYKELLAKKKI
jgi:peroxiredoxin